MSNRNVYGEDKQQLATKISNDALRDERLVIPQSGADGQPGQPQGDHKVPTKAEE